MIAFYVKHTANNIKLGLLTGYKYQIPKTQNSQDLKKSACSRGSKADEARGRPKKLLTNISALCLLQNPQEVYLRPY